MRHGCMKKYCYLALLAFLAMACHKDTRPVQSDKTDARLVQLKSVVTQGMPSPYFSYTYDKNNFVTQIQHAAGLFQYEVQYHNNRVVKMFNNTLFNKDTLVYHYSNNQVSSIDLVEPGTGITKVVELVYNSSHQLEELKWKKRNANLSLTLIRKLTFRYHDDGNLAEYQDHRDLGRGMELVQTHYFDAYDDKLNPESNHLIKDVFEHFIFLPQVQLQKNNPLRERIKLNENEWLITCSYTYDENLPVTKTVSRGGEQAVTTSTTFAY